MRRYRRHRRGHLDVDDGWKKNLGGDVYSGHIRSMMNRLVELMLKCSIPSICSSCISKNDPQRVGPELASAELYPSDPLPCLACGFQALWNRRSTLQQLHFGSDIQS